MIPYRTVENWEQNGTYGARAGELAKVAKVLLCTVEDILDES